MKRGVALSGCCERARQRVSQGRGGAATACGVRVGGGGQILLLHGSVHAW